jgi:hypothetical protein
MKDSEAIKKINLNWPNLREQVFKLLYNWKFIAGCFEEEGFYTREATNTPL